MEISDLEWTGLPSLEFSKLFCCFPPSLQLRDVLQPHPGPGQAAQEEAESHQPGAPRPAGQDGQDELQPGSL